MAECIYCGSETELYDGGVPVCLKCSEARQSERTQPNSEGVRTATTRVRADNLRQTVQG